MEVKPVVIFQASIGECPFHRRDIGVVELDGFQVGKAPPDLAQIGFQLDRAAIGGNRLFLLADGFQKMAEAHPYLGLARVADEDVAVDGDRFLIAADAAQGGGPKVEAAVGEVAVG